MFIDWFTVLAQVVNFLILVWLLKRFLYKPVLNAIEKREKRIADELKEAETKMAEAEKQKNEFSQKNQELDSRRNELFEKATSEAKTEQQRLMEEARKRYGDLKAQLQKSLQEEQEQISAEIKDRTQKEVLAITRKVLADLSSRNLEEQIVEVFIRRIKELDQTQRKEFLNAINPDSGNIVLKSAFSLNEKQKESLNQVMKELSGENIQPEYQNSPGIISGIELSAKGYKLSWSISAYLDSIEASLLNIKQHQNKKEPAKTSKDATKSAS